LVDGPVVPLGAPGGEGGIAEPAAEVAAAGAHEDARGPRQQSLPLETGVDLADANGAPDRRLERAFAAGIANGFPTWRACNILCLPLGVHGRGNHAWSADGFAYFHLIGSILLGVDSRSRSIG